MSALRAKHGIISKYVKNQFNLWPVQNKLPTTESMVIYDVRLYILETLHPSYIMGCVQIKQLELVE